MSSFQRKRKCVGMRPSYCFGFKLYHYSWPTRKIPYHSLSVHEAEEQRQTLSSLRVTNGIVNYITLIAKFRVLAERTQVEFEEEAVRSQFNLRMDVICTECNWKRTNMELHDFWYLLRFFFFLLIKGFALNSPAERGLNAKIEMAKIGIFLGSPFYLILGDSSCPFVHLSSIDWVGVPHKTLWLPWWIEQTDLL